MNISDGNVFFTGFEILCQMPQYTLVGYQTSQNASLNNLKTFSLRISRNKAIT